MKKYVQKKAMSSGGPPIMRSMGHINDPENIHVNIPATPVMSFMLKRGEHYHVWSRVGTELKHEGHGKFVRLQNDMKDALFEPFTISSGPQLESQVFPVRESEFYKLSNIKGGTRKSRKGRRKSRRHSRK